jgi:hypothetical protein
MKKILPLKPTDIIKEKERSFNPKVIEAVNLLLVEKYNGYSCTILQKDIIAKYIEICGITEEKRDEEVEKLFDKNQLDFEKIYQKYGWIVSYDKPGYNESYEASFEFKPKNKKS